MTLFTFFLVGALVALLVHAVSITDRRRQRSVQQMMDGIVTRRGQDTLDEISLLVRENKFVLATYRDSARRYAGDGQYDEAARRMDIGLRMIEALAPDFITALRALRRLARSVSVIVAIEPVSPRSFRTRKLVGLAALAELLHHFALTGKQQVRLRLRFLFAAFHLAMRWLRRSTSRITAGPANTREWRYVDALVSDLGTAQDETLVTAVQIVQALDAAELGSAVVRRSGQ